MKKMTLCLITVLSLFTQSIIAQAPLDGTTKVKKEATYKVFGKVSDASSGEAIVFCSVGLFQNGVLIKGGETDLNGVYSISVNSAGVYDLRVKYIGYAPSEVKDILVESMETEVHVSLSEGVLLTECIIIDYKEPLIKTDCTSSSTVTSEQIRSMPTRGSSLHARIAGLSIDGIRVGKKSSQKEEFNTEEYSHIVENQFSKTSLEPLSTFSIDVDRASYSNVRRFINQGKMPPVDAVRVEEMINYFPYAYDQPKEGEVFNVEHSLTDCPWNSKNQILHVGIQGEHFEKETLPATNFVFLIDVSGSMTSYGKLDLVKSSLNLLVDNMREKDRIALVVYAGSAGLVLGSTSGKYKGEIKTAIGALRSGGSTAGGAGIQLAYKVAKENFIYTGNNRVILATDGDFNIGVSSEGDLVRMIEEKRKENIFLSVLGYGMGNYKDNKMQKLADSGNGNHAYIDNLEEAKKTLVDEFGGTLFTIAKDVKIQIEFNPEFVKEYKLIGYENRMLKKEDFNDDRKDAGELGAGHTVTAFYEIVPAKRRKNESASVDDLKYQSVSSLENQSELATIKLRYKKPKGNRSTKIEQVISPILEEEVSSEVDFALCVAEFGMLLRESKSVKNRSFEDLLERVDRLMVEQDGKGDEYRDEFVGLVSEVVNMQMDY